MRPDFASKLEALAGLGLSRQAVGALIGAFLPDDLSADDLRFLMGPLVIHRNGWTDTLPKWVADVVSAERVAIVLGDMRRFIVGPAEIGAVMYPATMEAPLRSEHADVYCWAMANAMARRGGKPASDYFAIMDMRPIADAEVVGRGGRLFDPYRRLAEDIRRKVIAAQADREREGKRAMREAERSETASRPVPQPAFVQSSLFDF